MQYSGSGSLWVRLQVRIIQLRSKKIEKQEEKSVIIGTAPDPDHAIKKQKDIKHEEKNNHSSGFYSMGCSLVSCCSLVSLQQSGRYISQPNQIRILNYSRRAKNSMEPQQQGRQQQKGSQQHGGTPEMFETHPTVFRIRKFVGLPVPGYVIVGTPSDTDHSIKKQIDRKI
jgi:hypothetical protein